MTQLFERVDALLREPHRDQESVSARTAVFVIVVFGAFYGAVMGSFGVDHPRVLQMAFAAAKVPFLIGATFLLSLPGFFVLSNLLGLRDDFAESLRALALSQAVLTVVLASLATMTFTFYLSSSNYSHALLFNGLMFAIASFAAQRVLVRLYQPLTARDNRHRQMLRAWLVTYAFVGIQMGWVLRPFIGNPDDPTTFLRQEAWGNAYEAVFQHIRNLSGG